MLIERSLHPQWLSNTYLVADKPGGKAVLIDTGAPMGPILQAARDMGVQVTHALCTHHHYDHVENNGAYKQEFGCSICGHGAESDLFGDLDIELTDGQELSVGELRIRPIHIPGHTLGQLAFLINDQWLFTGDTLFRDSVGGTRGPGHTTFEDLRHSIMNTLLALPGETIVYPGHMDSTTLQRERDENPFIRMWRGLDEPQEKPCTAAGLPGTLLLRARDYDGGTKCWVRFADGSLDLVAGSQVQD